LWWGSPDLPAKIRFYTNFHAFSPIFLNQTQKITHYNTLITIPPSQHVFINIKKQVKKHFSTRHRKPQTRKNGTITPIQKLFLSNGIVFGHVNRGKRVKLYNPTHRSRITCSNSESEKDKNTTYPI